MPHSPELPEIETERTVAAMSSEMFVHTLYGPPGPATFCEIVCVVSAVPVPFTELKVRIVSVVEQV